MPAQYGPAIAVEHCRACHLFWFDELESMRLSGPGWLQLLRQLLDSPQAPAPAPGVQLQCPRCALPLRTQHNQTRFGHFTLEVCPHCRGHAQGQALLLAERGLFRRLLPVEFAALQREGQTPECLHCGAALEAGQPRCRHCQAPALRIDLARWLQAIALRSGRALQAAAPAQPLAWTCQACGQALDATRHPHCPQCQHPVLLPHLSQLPPLLEAMLAQREQLPTHEPGRVAGAVEPRWWRHSIGGRLPQRGPGPRPHLWLLLRFGLPLLLMVAAMLLLRCSRG